MRVALDDDQRDRRDAAAAFLGAVCRTTDVRASRAAREAMSRDRWRQLATMGLTSVAVAESFGGLGADDVDLVVLLEEVGHVALPEPLGPAAVAAALLAEVAPEAAARWLPALVTGEVVVTVALPGARYVEHAAAADVIVLADATGAVRVLERGDVALEEQPALDGAHRLHRIVRRREVEPVVSSAVAAVARAADRAVLYAAAESLGVGRRSLALSVAYAKDRHQFGRAIGSFQALKHRLADDWIALEFARPLVWRAAWAVARDLQDATLHVSAAKAAASDAAMRCARSAVQVHGAMGYTFECDVQLFLTRAQALGAAHGTARAHRRRIATVLRHRDIARVP